ncbi:MAG: DUF6603 domain-containing protein [Gammaproteobacteria bacterium]
MADTGVFAGIVGYFADIGNELATSVTDSDKLAALIARSGKLPPATPPPSDTDTANALAALRDRASAEGASETELITDLGGAITDLVALVQGALSLSSADDAWNMVATLLDFIAVDRFRKNNLELVALLKAAHLLSDDRLLFADLIRSKDQWGTFLLGNPADDEAKADNWSLIIGAALAVAGKWIPQEDSQGKPWLLDLLFGWDPDPNTAAPQAQRALQRMATMRFSHRDPFGDGDTAEEHVGFSTAVVPPGYGGWGVFFGLDVGGGVTFPIGQNLEFVIEADSPNAFQAYFGDPAFFTPGFEHSTAKVTLRRKSQASDHWNIGSSASTHLEIGTFGVGVEIGDPMRFHLAIGNGALVIPQSAFGFMKAVIPEAGVKFTFDADLAIDTQGKLAFTGGAGLTVVLPVNRSILALRVRSITIAFALEEGDTGSVTLGVGVAYGIDFGEAFKIDVDNIGTKLAWKLPSSPQPPGATQAIARGNLGPSGNLGIDFVPPRGIGITINAGPVKGGGFFYFDPDHRTYAGVIDAALALCGKGIQIKAAGLLRETDEGWDFVLILSAEFEPAIEIFLGLTLNGVGGMLGINVAVSVDKLRSALHDGSLGKLLFPTDPIANAPAIIATMIAVFPHRQGGVVAGPMLKLGWGRPSSFVTLSAAVVVALPSPALLLIMGRLRVLVWDEKLGPVVINADFLGEIDFQQPSFSFDASLIDSRIAAFTLTGDMAMRAGPPGFMLSIGGFNPRFQPPADMPSLRRIAIDISANPITKIRAEAYLAITSNTFQVGLHASLDIDAGPASIHGWLDFDALVEWEPRFEFSIHMDIGLELRVSGESIAGVSVDLLLEGPNPWHAKGEASLHILFFTVHAGFEVTWGETHDAAPPPRVDAGARVAQALAEEGAWTAIAPDGDSWVTFRAVNRDDIGVHPYGTLSVRQQAVPIGIPITRIGRSAVVGDTATVSLAPIAGAPAAAPTTGQFAASQFNDLDDDQRMSRPSFESYQDGVSFGAVTTSLSAEQTSTASYETVFIPEMTRRKKTTLDPRLFAHALDFGSVARSGLHFATLHDGPDQRVAVSDATYRVVAADTLKAASAVAYGSSAAAYAQAGKLEAQRVLVVAEHEMVS